MVFEQCMCGKIKSLMCLDSTVLRCRPDAVLMEDMRHSLLVKRKNLVIER